MTKFILSKGSLVWKQVLGIKFLHTRMQNLTKMSLESYSAKQKIEFLSAERTFFSQESVFFKNTRPKQVSWQESFRPKQVENTISALTAFSKLQEISRNLLVQKFLTPHVREGLIQNTVCSAN